MSIFLIRHGETAGNANRVVQVPETPLSERGLGQARRLAERLRDANVERILSSDLRRAAMTAEALQAVTDAPLEVEPLLQERNFGELRGVPYDELDTPLFDPALEPSGGESWEVFHRRVVDAGANRGREAPLYRNLAVVTHGLVLHSILVHHVTLPDELEPPRSDGPPLPMGNTALTIVTEPGPWSVVRLACIDHLEDDAITPALLPLKRRRSGTVWQRDHARPLILIRLRPAAVWRC